MIAIVRHGEATACENVLVLAERPARVTARRLEAHGRDCILGCDQALDRRVRSHELPAGNVVGGRWRRHVTPRLPWHYFSAICRFGERTIDPAQRIRGAAPAS